MGRAPYAADRPNIARSVNVKNMKVAITMPTSAIAVVGRFSNGISGSIALKKIPNVKEIKYLGYRETLLKNSCIIQTSTAF